MSLLILLRPLKGGDCLASAYNGPASMGCFVASLDTSGTSVDGRLLKATIDVPPFDAARARVWTGDAVGCAWAPLRSTHRVDACHFTHSNGLTIVMAGRLDDRTALVRMLEAELERGFRDASDAGLVLAAYECWGTECASRLLGDFSFCLWDAERRQLFGARDHLGVKPLFYARVGRALFVSNVLRSIRHHPDVSDRLDSRAICDMLLAGAVMDQSRTSFAGVARVPPAHTFTCTADRGAMRIERFWSFQPGLELRLPEPREYVEGYCRVLKTVVADRVGDQPFGVLMSGGLDSSSVAATAADLLGPELAAAGMRAYTVVYDSATKDQERHYASLVSRRLGIEIEYHRADEYAWFARWDKGLLPPEPTTEPMTAITADVLERASHHGAVVLTGDGGDPALLPSTLLGLFGRTPLRALARDVWQSGWRTRSFPPIGLRAMMRQWWSRESEVPSWLSSSFVRDCDPHARLKEIAALRAPADGPRGLAVSSVVDPWWTSMFETYDPGATLRPVELRYPLFDVRLLSLAVTLPTHPWCVNKGIVRRAMQGRLPDEVCARPKVPLAVDLQETHGRWEADEVANAIEALPQLAQFVDVRAFRSLRRTSGLVTSDEPGAWPLVALAAWLRCSAAASVTE
jgi:asparagine synthase (glutamine-hydrolysing)